MPCRCLRLRLRPAVSTSTNVASPRRSTVSIESRVVRAPRRRSPARCPRSAFSSDDFPTFGRPRIATRIASSPTGRSPFPGAARRCRRGGRPVPCPCSAESGIGSPRPSRWNSSASASRRGSSSLFAITSTSRRDERRISRELLVARRDPRPRVDDEEDEVGLLDACLACSTICAPERARVAWSTPPVSISRNVVPDHSTGSSLRSRVTPGVSWTTAARVAVEPVDQRRLPDVRVADDRHVPAISTGGSRAPRLVEVRAEGARAATCLIVAASRRAGARARGCPRATPTAPRASARPRRGLLVARAAAGEPRRRSSARRRRPRPA